VPGAELRGILQRARAEAERRAGPDRNSKSRSGRPGSSMTTAASPANGRSATPLSVVSRSTAGGGGGGGGGFSPLGGAAGAVVAAASGAVGAIIKGAAGAAAAAGVGAVDEMLYLLTAWPRTAEQLVSETAALAEAEAAAKLAALQAGDPPSKEAEAAAQALAYAIAAGTPPVPHSLALQARALMARVPEIVAEREV